MIYDGMTYEFILNRMIDRVKSNYPNLDDREGSIIFNALAPAAIELAIAYTELDNTRNESIVSTATREYLLIACEQMGMDINQFEASAGVHKGEFDVEVPVGSTWNCELFNYTVTEFIEMSGDYYTYRMTCDTVGTAPNNQTGDLIPITDMPDGLTYAKVTECLIEGENQVEDDDIRSAYFEFVNNSTTDGNVAQYERWCAEYDGIGNAKITPLWNGDNTVKVSILSASNGVASDELIAEFQAYLDPGITGMGDGVAPIGAFVTVNTATEFPISISGTVSMKPGYTDTSTIDTALTDYFAEVAYKTSTIAYMTIGAAILNAEGVAFVTNLEVNGGTSDVTLGEEEIPVLGTTNWVVS